VTCSGRVTIDSSREMRCRPRPRGRRLLTKIQLSPVLCPYTQHTTHNTPGGPCVVPGSRSPPRSLEPGERAGRWACGQGPPAPSASLYRRINMACRKSCSFMSFAQRFACSLLIGTFSCRWNFSSFCNLRRYNHHPCSRLPQPGQGFFLETHACCCIKETAKTCQVWRSLRRPCSCRRKWLQFLS
jgi:hypothetical protein